MLTVFGIIYKFMEIKGVLQQGDSVHMECRVSPINDSRLTVHWLKDGKPLLEASRFKPSCEFGFVTLEILYAYPEDSGIYECVVVNDKGEASTKTIVTVCPLIFLFNSKIKKFWLLSQDRI